MGSAVRAMSALIAGFIGVTSEKRISLWVYEDFLRAILVKVMSGCRRRWRLSAGAGPRART